MSWGILFWKAWKWVRENALPVFIFAALLTAAWGGWYGRGKWDADKIARVKADARACEAEVVVWKGAADANDRSRAALESTLKEAAEQWAKVAEELTKTAALQRADLAVAAKRNDDLWTRYRDSLTAMLPSDCESAVRETVRRLKEVAR